MKAVAAILLLLSTLHPATQPTTQPSVAEQAGLSIVDGRLHLAKPVEGADEEEGCQYIDIPPLPGEDSGCHLCVTMHGDEPYVEFYIARVDSHLTITIALTQRPDGSVQIDCSSARYQTYVAIFKNLSEMTDLGTNHTLDNWLAADATIMMKRIGVATLPHGLSLHAEAATEGNATSGQGSVRGASDSEARQNDR